MGRFIQSIYNIFRIVGDAIKGIVQEFKDGNRIIKKSIPNAFSKSNARKWLYFIPAFIIFVLGVLYVVLL